MALSQAQWYSKLKSWVPTWFFGSEQYQLAHWQALAKVLANIQLESEAQRDETFILRSSGDIPDLHGNERTVIRLDSELAGTYKDRIRNISNKVNKPDLKSIVDSLLYIGECSILEDYEGAGFCDRGEYIDRDFIVSLEDIYNAFTVIFQSQVPQPFAYLDRDNFLDRDIYAGSLTAPDAFFTAIVQAIEENKALGTLFRVIERAS